MQRGLRVHSYTVADDLLLYLDLILKTGLLVYIKHHAAVREDVSLNMNEVYVLSGVSMQRNEAYSTGV